MNILKKIKPSKNEGLFIRIQSKKFIKKLNNNSKDAKAVLGGSFEKNTWISGNYDVDIFVKFNYEKYHKKDISKELERSLKGLIKTKIHGSRDYFQVKQGKVKFEIVPVLDIKNYKQALNVTDVSPLHSKYIKKNTTGRQQDEIRIAKQFLAANNLYGAESHIKGFSGYLTELLIIYYENFLNFIKSAAKWPDSKIIDMKKFYKNSREVTRSLNWSKKGPLIMIDPVQKNRNVAAALSQEKYNKLRSIARNYLRNPSDIFFEKKIFNHLDLKGSSVLEITPMKGKQDVIGAKLLKLLNYMIARIKAEGFELIDYNWNFDKKTHFWFKVTNLELNTFKKHMGPNRSDKKNLSNFRIAWDGYKIHYDHNKSFVLLERKHTNFRDFLKSLIKEKRVKDSVKSIHPINN